jgi:hypothetical protein
MLGVRPWVPHVLQGVEFRQRDACRGVTVSKNRLIQRHPSAGVALREPGHSQNVTIGFAIALVLVAAIVPALPQSSWMAIATQLCIGPPVTTFRATKIPAGQTVE